MGFDGNKLFFIAILEILSAILFLVAFVVFFLTCLVRKHRVLLGLTTEFLLLVIVMVVRVAAMISVHSSVTAKLLLPEGVLAALL
jgi:hypothetical protein